jgi:sugar phosphate isomerase/epimerase
MTAPRKSDRFSWGFSTLGCPDSTLPQIGALLAEFDLHELEIRAVEKRIDLPQWSQESGWSVDRASQLFAQHAIHFRVAGSSFKLVGNDERSRLEMLAFTQWAESWGARYVRAFGAGNWGQPLTENDYSNAVQGVQWWREEKRKHNWRIELLLETHDAFSASPPCRELQARLGEPLGIIWDSHHTWRLAGESPRHSWSQLGPWIRHVHIKDSIPQPSARHPHTYVLPGDGDVPLSDIITVLRENDFAETVSLEWEKMWHPYLPPLRDALASLKAQPWFSATTNEIPVVNAH